MEAVGNLARLLEEKRAHEQQVAEWLEQEPSPFICPECGRPMGVQ